MFVSAQNISSRPSGWRVTGTALSDASDTTVVGICDSMSRMFTGAGLPAVWLAVARLTVGFVKRLQQSDCSPRGHFALLAGMRGEPGAELVESGVTCRVIVAFAKLFHCLSATAAPDDLQQQILLSGSYTS